MKRIVWLIVWLVLLIILIGCILVYNKSTVSEEGTLVQGNDIGAECLERDGYEA